MAKGGLISALLKKSRAKRETARKKRYLQHYKKAGKHHAMTYAQWIKEGQKTAYYGKSKKGKTVEAQLRELRIDPTWMKKKRKK